MSATRAAAEHGRTLVLYGAGAGEAARRMLPGLPDACFAPADPDGSAGTVARGVARGVVQLVLVAGPAELAAVAGAGALEAVTRDMDGGAALTAEVARAPSAAHAYGLWQAAGVHGPCGRELCRRTAGELERRAAEAAGAPESPVAAQVVLVDAEDGRMVGMFGRMAR
ncbi:hypothetical protein [Actinomadura roseirufa]|uniref:hypothetical protein n=1 Tax=Actinomadura roseirufa TaxID=2094049 RepID=UPI001041BBA9|nr:hypothetical protein [Actinomadura roseirufa]